MKITTTNFVLCGECIKLLENGYQYHLWKSSCIKHFTLLLDDENPEKDIIFLEHNGFICTTEKQNALIDHHFLDQIIIKPCKGVLIKNIAGDSMFYCAKPKEHAENENCNYGL